jgi:hypothetical protein
MCNSDVLKLQQRKQEEQRDGSTSLLVGAAKRRRTMSALATVNDRRFAPPPPRLPRNHSMYVVTCVCCWFLVSPSAFCDSDDEEVCIGSRATQHSSDLLSRLIDDESSTLVLRGCLLQRVTTLVGIERPTRSHQSSVQPSTGTHSAPQTPLHEPPLSTPSSPLLSDAGRSSDTTTEMQTDDNTATTTTTSATTTTTQRMLTEGQSATTVWLTLPRDSANQAPVRRLRAWANRAPHLFDVLALLAARPALCQHEALRLLIGALLSTGGRGEARAAGVELQRLALWLRRVGWLAAPLAAAADSLRLGAPDDARRLLHALHIGVLRSPLDAHAAARHWLGALLLADASASWPLAHRMLSLENR